MELASLRNDSRAMKDNMSSFGGGCDVLARKEDASSLPAVLLGDGRCEFLKRGEAARDGMSASDAAYLIPFKAKAWLDSEGCKAKGDMPIAKASRSTRMTFSA